MSFREWETRFACPSALEPSLEQRSALRSHARVEAVFSANAFATLCISLRPLSRLAENLLLPIDVNNIPMEDM